MAATATENKTYIDKVIQRICNREGSRFTNDPLDPGGATKYGITLKTLRGWRGDAHLGPDEVRDLTLDEACKIYKKLFVERPGFLLLGDDAIAEQLIDYGVNHGVDTAIRALQKIVGAHIDGDIGNDTVTHFNAKSPRWKTFTGLMSARAALYSDIISKRPSQKKWAGGWMNRIGEMSEIYINAVTFDSTTEGLLLEAAHTARQMSQNIQGSPDVRKKSATLFAQLSAKFAAL